MDVIISKERGIGKITLNREKKLNALTIPMIESIWEALDTFLEDKSVELVLIQSSSTKAFSAGADVKLFYDNGIENAIKSIAFCHKEYNLCAKLESYEKPYIALVDGIVMGGGVGITLFGSHFVATDRMVFAMPEVGIGFFPDVASSYFLSRLPHAVGNYLALTGKSINANDAKAIGLIKHVIDHQRVSEFIDLLPSHLDEGLRLCQKEEEKCSLDLQKIDRAFSHKDLFDVIETWGESDFKGKCPLSVMLAHKLMHIGKTLSFQEAIALDCKIAARLLKREEVYEGIYHRLIAKKLHPDWLHPLEWPFPALEAEVKALLA